MKPIVIFALLMNQMAAADTIRLRADSWCPYNCDPESDKPGILVEMAKLVFEKAGHRVDYSLMSWARAKEDARQGRIEGIVGAYRDDGKDFFFPSVPQAISTQRLFVRKGETWTYKDESSLEGRKIGVIKDYTYEEVTDGLIKKQHPSFVVLGGDQPLIQLIAMLEKKRLTAFYEDPKVVKFYFTNVGRSMDSVEERGFIKDRKSPTYIAFSPKNPKSKSYAEFLAKGTAELKKSGDLKKIYEKYGLSFESD